MSKNFIKIPEDYFALTKIKELNYGHVCLLSKIESLAFKDGKCTASNGYFASLLNTTDRTIKRMMSDLRENDIIKTFEKKQGIKTTTRFIYLQHDMIKSLIGTGDNNDTSISEAGDISGNSRGQNVSEEVSSLVEGGDNIGQSRCQDCPPNNRLEENKKDNKRIIKENEADASDESSFFATAKGDAKASSKSDSDNKFGEFGFPEVDLADDVIALFEKGYKYKSDNPQIQKATGLNGKQIHKIISAYIESGSGSGAGNGKSKDNMSEHIPLVNGGFSNFRYSSIDVSFKDLDIDNEDDKETCIHVFNLYTDPDGEFKFDYHSLKSYLKEKYNFNITGKFNPQKSQKIDYQKANAKSDTGNDIESLADEIFDINGIGVDVDLMNELYADDYENPDVPF